MKSSSNKKPLLIMEKIYKSYGGVQALSNAHIEVLPGEIHALLGENGAGKSTLVKIIAGAVQRDAGKIIWKGKPIEIASLSDAFDLGIRVIYQNLNVINHLTVGQNLTLGRENNQMGIINNKVNRSQSMEILQLMGVNLEIDHIAGDLRVAERQLIEIGRALRGDVNLLVMDEPTSSLGDKEIKQLFQIMSGLRDRGVAIIFISHKLDETLEIADRITVLRDGQWIGTAKKTETDEEELVEMMVGRKIRHEISRGSQLSDEVVLEVDHLWTDTGLKDISFRLHRGELLGIYGLMGSGRTELARALFGADPIIKGNIIVNGKQITFHSPIEAKRQGIGLIPEDKSLALFYLCSVRENLSSASSELISKNGIINRKTERSFSQKIIDRLWIRTPSMEDPVARLSGGNQQKVIIGRWLMRDVPILILDDPTCGIDVGVKQELYKFLNQMTVEKTSIIMSSSELPELLALSDRMLILHEGKVVGILSGKEMNQRNVIHLAVRGVKGGNGKKRNKKRVPAVT